MLSTLAVASSVSASAIRAGSINERGFINSLDRQGFTFNKSLCELNANLIDAYADVGLFINNYPNNITLIDDGVGMQLEKFINMVDILETINNYFDGTCVIIKKKIDR